MARALEREFGLAAVPAESPDRPERTYDPRRGQHSSSQILKWLVAKAPPGARRVLGVTDVDLFIPILTFVFGEAQMNGRAAVVSTARLAGAGSPADGRRLPHRLAAECVHEVGHTFGLVHCGTPRCAMGRAASLLDVDEKTSALCADCRERFRAFPFDNEGDP